MLFLALVVAAILTHVFRSTRITRETIAGAVCVYLLVGVDVGSRFFDRRKLGARIPLLTILLKRRPCPVLSRYATNPIGLLISAL